MTLITFEDGKPLMKDDGKIGTEQECCCGIKSACLCTAGLNPNCEDGLTAEECASKYPSSCAYEIFEAQLGFVPLSQEDCPEGWNWDGVNGCNTDLCNTGGCETCDEQNPYGNGTAFCADIFPAGEYIAGQSCDENPLP